MRTAIPALLSILISSITADAADICRGLVVKDVGALENPEAVLHRGEYDYSIAQYRVPKSGGYPVFCSH